MESDQVEPLYGILDDDLPRTTRDDYLGIDRSGYPPLNASHFPEPPNAGVRGAVMTIPDEGTYAGVDRVEHAPPTKAAPTPKVPSRPVPNAHTLKGRPRRSYPGER